MVLVLKERGVGFKGTEASFKTKFILLAIHCNFIYFQGILFLFHLISPTVNKQLHHRTKRQKIIDKTNKTIVKQNFHKHIKNPKNKIYRVFIELLELKKFYWNPKCIKCPDNNFPTFAFWNDHSFIISSISCWISSNLRCIMWYCLYPSLNEKIRLTQKIIILLFPANCSSIKSQHKSIIINGILNLRQME